MTDDRRNLVGYCGIDCTGCPVYRTYREGDEKTKFQMAFAIRCTLDQIRCEGCRSGDRFLLSTFCIFRKCARGRGLEACAFCADFPCETISEFYTRGTPVQKEALENSKRIKEVGIDAWLDETGKK